MRLGEELVTYAFGLIAVALIIRNGPGVSNIINTISGSTGTFARTIIGPGGG